MPDAEVNESVVVVAFVSVAPAKVTREAVAMSCGSESVHVRFADKSCAPAEEVIWFVVPATVIVRSVVTTAVPLCVIVPEAFNAPPSVVISPLPSIVEVPVPETIRGESATPEMESVPAWI